MTAAVLNTNNGWVKNKIPDVSDVVTTVWSMKYSEVENKISNDSKYITTLELSKFAGKIFVQNQNKEN